MTGKRTEEEMGSYEHAGKDRLNLATDETMVALNAESIADADANLESSEPSYPRLAWQRGAAADDLSVEHGPLHVHEKVDPSEFIRTQLKKSGSAGRQRDMFATFDGVPEGAAFEPYTYRGNWRNRLVKATSQRMMASLLEREGMRGKVDMAYMDPPYNIDFKSNMQGLVDDLDVREELDSLPADLGQIQAFRDSYRNGVHSYLDQLRANLMLTRALLADTGSMFLQIGPSNLHAAGMLMAEVFGSENHVATIPYVTAMNHSTRMLPEIGNWLIWFAKDKSQAKYRQIYEELPSLKDKLGRMSWTAAVEMPDGSCRKLTREEREDPDRFLPEGARLYDLRPLTSTGVSTTGRSDPWIYNANAYPCPSGRHWRVSHEGLHSIAAQGRVDFSSSSTPTLKRYDDEIPGVSISAAKWNFHAQYDKTYAVQTPQAVVERCILMTTDPGDLVLDPTCGSGTTAVAAEKWGRRWITSDSSAVAVTVAKSRLLAQNFDWYVLQDSPEGAKLEWELSGGNPSEFVEQASYGNDPGLGFVCERQRRLSAAMLAYDRREYIHFVDRPLVEQGKKRLASPFTVESDSRFKADVPELRERGASAEATRERACGALASSGINCGGGGGSSPL